jgi:flagellar biosynthesis/type III secretory pathway protein FliH
MIFLILIAIYAYYIYKWFKQTREEALDEGFKQGWNEGWTKACLEMEFRYNNPGAYSISERQLQDDSEPASLVA